MTDDSEVHDARTTMVTINITTMSRTNAPQAMSPVEKLEKLAGIDFKRNYILSNLQDDLYNVYSGTKTAKELWGALEWKYKTEDAETKNFFINFLEDIPYWPKPVAPVCIHCDSQATIVRAGSMMYNDKSHHIRQRHNTVRELLSSGVIIVDYVKSNDNVLDSLTKGLSREGVERTSKGMGLRPRTSQHGGNST
ncbi:hypothetical protein BC332_03176 [Capsicum chinense]|nr:hypothetical protein BC332_03176 [Capsicum chinense]